MWEVGFGDCGGGGAGAGLEGVVGKAVDSRFKGFVIGTPAYMEGGGMGPLLLVGCVWGGCRGYAGGFAVGEEGRVRGDVGYEVVECGAGIGEYAGGGEGLEWG